MSQGHRAGAPELQSAELHAPCARSPGCSCCLRRPGHWATAPSADQGAQDRRCRAAGRRRRGQLPGEPGQRLTLLASRGRRRGGAWADCACSWRWDSAGLELCLRSQRSRAEQSPGVLPLRWPQGRQTQVPATLPGQEKTLSGETWICL